MKAPAARSSVPSRPPDRADLVKDVVHRIAHSSPKLQELSAEQLDKLARAVVAETLKDDLRRAADRERVDYRAERQRFLERASRSGSPRTRKLYAAALARLEAWCTAQHLSPLELTPGRADDWISELKAAGRAPATVRLEVSAASAFFTWLERRHPQVTNPLRGTKERPAARPTRPLAVPSQEEIEQLAAAADPVLRAAILVMARAGLRVGGLPALTIHGERFATSSKRMDYTGDVPVAARRAIEKAELSLRTPFAKLTASQLSDRFAYLSKKLHAAGTLRARYSVHDLRHSYALMTYRDTRDIYRVKEALGHTTVAVTESYLRSLNVDLSSRAQPSSTPAR